MKTLFRTLMIFVLGFSFVPAVPAQIGGTVYAKCRKFVPERNCYKCGEYFHARSEDEAVKKCGKKGYDQAFYFRSMGSMQRWMLGNCTCDNDEND